MDEHRVAVRIRGVSFRDRVSPILRTVDLPERKRGRIRHLESMHRVLGFVFSLRASDDRELQTSQVWHIDGWIKHFRHHTVRERKPNLRCPRH